MKKRITDNWGLKLFSFIFAVLLWLVVVNIDNPVKSNTFDNVQVRFQNANLVTEEDLVYEVLDSSDVLSVTVSAPRSYLEQISKDDIVAIADFGNITKANTINITYYSKRYNDKITNFKGSAESVKLNIEPKKEMKLVLKTSTVGDAEEGFMVGNITTDQNQVRISGPESVVSKVSKAAVSVDVSGTTTDIATYADVKLYDSDDNEVSLSNIRKNVDTVKVNVEILEKKTVPVKYSVTGVPASGYRQSGEISAEVTEVLIAGNSNVVKNVSQIEVPAELLNIAGKTEDLTANVNLKNYLPSGVILADSEFNGKITVTVPIQEEQRRELRLTPNHISIVNVPEGYRADIDEDSDMVLEVTGLRADISALRLENIAGVVDIAAYMEEEDIQQLEAGNYVVEAAFELEENITIVRPVEVRLIIEELEENDG